MIFHHRIIIILTILKACFYCVIDNMKRCVLLACLIAAASPAFAELKISEKIRPANPVRSMVNPDIPRLQTPSTPNNMSLPAFGRGIIGWGTGPEGAKQRLENVTAADVAKFKQQGVTLEMLQQWQAFYQNETQRNPGNPAANYRAQLMTKIISLW